MTDDLVKRLREGDEFERFMLTERAADRIEELEAKLAKVKEAFLINMMDALPDYTHEMFDKDYAKITGKPAYDLGEMVSEFDAIVSTTLAELKENK